MEKNFKKYSELYRNELLKNVLPFWDKYSVDKDNGGFITCLDKDGRRFDTDKFLWIQGRQTWIYSMLYNKMEKKPEWLEMAKHGADFLKKYGMDYDGNFYFSLTQDGKPLVQPYNIFSDCFACMAFAQYGIAANDQESVDLSLKIYRNIIARKDNTKGQYNKAFPGTRSLKNFALPMILCNLTLELEDVLPKPEVDKAIEICEYEVMEVFLNKDDGLIYENVNPDGTFSDTFDGRLINPGHGIEAMWFIMDTASRRGDSELIKRAVDTAIRIVEYGWDKKFGGILYFMDSKGNPPQQLEWDQKLWWVHVEALIALSKGYLLTGDERCWEWYQKIHEYTWKRYPDHENGEWFGYLNRQGEILLPLKGGKWKGCFHIPRGLYQCMRIFENLESRC